MNAFIRLLMTNTLVRFFVKHWKWLLPTVVAAWTVFGILFALSVLHSMRSSPVSQKGLDLVRSNQTVITALGEPIEPGFLVSGRIREDLHEGQANLHIPVSGPNGSGYMHAQGEKKMGRWKLTGLYVQITGSDDLIPVIAEDAGSEP